MVGVTDAMQIKCLGKIEEGRKRRNWVHFLRERNVDLYLKKYIENEIYFVSPNCLTGFIIFIIYIQYIFSNSLHDMDDK